MESRVPGLARDLEAAAESILHKPIWHVSSSHSSGSGFVMKIGGRRRGLSVTIDGQPVELANSEYTLGVLFDCGWSLTESSVPVTSWEDTDSHHRVGELKSLVGQHFTRATFSSSAVAFELSNGTQLDIWPRGDGRYHIGMLDQYVVLDANGAITRTPRGSRD